MTIEGELGSLDGLCRLERHIGRHGLGNRGEIRPPRLAQAGAPAAAPFVGEEFGCAWRGWREMGARGVPCVALAKRRAPVPVRVWERVPARTDLGLAGDPGCGMAAGDSQTCIP